MCVWFFNIVAQTSIDACSNFTRVDNYYTRSINYTKQPWDLEECESQNTTAGWYGFVYGENIPTYAPAPYQCGTLSPIWFDGMILKYNTDQVNTSNVYFHYKQFKCVVYIQTKVEMSFSLLLYTTTPVNVIYISRYITLCIFNSKRLIVQNATCGNTLI